MLRHRPNRVQRYHLVVLSGAAITTVTIANHRDLPIGLILILVGVGIVVFGLGLRGMIVTSRRNH